MASTSPAPAPNAWWCRAVPSLWESTSATAFWLATVTSRISSSMSPSGNKGATNATSIPFKCMSRVSVIEPASRLLLGPPPGSSAPPGPLGRRCDWLGKTPTPAPAEMRTLSAEETCRLLEAARGDELKALYVLALSTGMRQGELLALKWDDVNLERGVLRVRRTLTHAGKAFVLGEPKTKKSRRTIRLTTGAVQALSDHLSRQLEETEEGGSLPAWRARVRCGGRDHHQPKL